jgi:hypothetical protein
METDGRKISNPNLYTGAASAFRRAGFQTLAAHAPHRPIMRLNMGPAAPAP